MGNRIIKQVPAYHVPEVDGTVRNLHLNVTNNLFRVDGVGYDVLRVQQDGTLSNTHGTAVWFIIPQGCRFKFRIYDIKWKNNSGNQVSLAAKWGVTTSESNFATAEFLMDTGTSGTGGEAEYTSEAYASERIINSFVVQLTRNKGNGCECEFKMELFINGIRYF